MRKQTFVAIAATFLLGAASLAHAGEGSPDLSLPIPHGNDPSGDTNGGYFGPRVTYGYTPGAFGYSNGYSDGYMRGPRNDTNTGSAVRQRVYEDDTGIND